jgi:uncharacterized protein (DUF305 family)
LISIPPGGIVDDMKRILAVLLPLLLVTACAGTKKVDKEHNEADIAFAQAMIPHHEQAVEMADLVDDAEASPEVQQLAQQIKDAQAPEIERLREFLDDWDAEAATGHDTHDGHDSMPGMMADSELTSLAAASGTEFDRAWLTMMIAHHEGAVAMAQTQLDDGRSEPAHELAEQIISAQDAEITTMKELLR